MQLTSIYYVACLYQLTRHIPKIINQHHITDCEIDNLIILDHYKNPSK